MELKFRPLKASEIDARIQQLTVNNKALVLLYKDARCDMRLLDEVVTPLGWQRSHEIIGGRLYCTVSVFNKDTNEWVSKSDVGTESNTEQEKGQASDSFKRACFNWGIGRELYTAPVIYIPLKPDEIKEKSGRKQCYTKFVVYHIAYDDAGNITELGIKDSNGEPRFKWQAKKNG
uniref:Rad52/22 family double-strand break repair protein n=1 Tax=Siphoviridae sp. ct3q24 TaxID=2827772 RepID=A0A8S5SFD2_9CAUD|nr:MAG TPA: Rad52/22 family double-strand break repair protein [Siphoviridae sp. ct3q24]